MRQISHWQCWGQRFESAMLHLGLAEMQVLFRVCSGFLQDAGVKGFMFVNDVKVLTTFLTTT